MLPSLKEKKFRIDSKVLLTYGFSLIKRRFV